MNQRTLTDHTHRTLTDAELALVSGGANNAGPIIGSPPAPEPEIPPVPGILPAPTPTPVIVQ